MEKRIVVTGLGIVSPLGIGVNENWDRYFSGMSGIKEFETNGNGQKTYAGKVSDHELETFVPLGIFVILTYKNANPEQSFCVKGKMGFQSAALFIVSYRTDEVIIKYIEDQDKEPPDGNFKIDE